MLFVVSVATVSCSKKGCINENATNYNAEAKKDDGSCVYPTEVEIKRVTADVFPLQDSNGNSWDNPGDADCYIKIKNGNGDGLYQSSSYVNPQSSISWYIDPALVITDFSNSQEIVISMYDEDGLTDDFMGEVTINISEYTLSGTNSSKYPDTISFSDSNFTYTLDVIWK